MNNPNNIFNKVGVLMNLQNYKQQYSLSKSLRFELKPIGKTLQFVQNKRLIENDKELNLNISKIKNILTDYHRYFINQVLNDTTLDLSLLVKAFESEDKDVITDQKNILMKQIVERFKRNTLFDGLFGSDVVDTHLLQWSGSLAYDSSVFESVKGYGGLLLDYHAGKKWIYEAGEGHTVANRIIEDNAIIFYRNIIVLKQISDAISINNIVETCGYKGSISDFINPKLYGNFISQTGINNYNLLITGYSTETSKHQGINELVAQHNQTADTRLPFLTKLKKQILSNEQTISFRFDSKVNSDQELLEIINQSYMRMINSNILKEICTVFVNIESYNLEQIFVSYKWLKNLSHQVYKNFGTIYAALEYYYSNVFNPCHGKITVKYLNNQEKFIKKQDHSLKSIYDALLAHQGKELAMQLIATIKSTKLVDSIFTTHEVFNKEINNLDDDFSLVKNKSKNHIIKDFLDSILDLNRFLKQFKVDEPSIDLSFYANLDSFLESISEWVSIHRKSEAYLTGKPFTDDKFMLTFNALELLNGWDKDKEANYRTSILQKDGLYYLAVSTDENKKFFTQLGSTGTGYKRMEYKQVTGANKMLPKVFFSAKGLDTYKPSPKILEDYKLGKHKKGKDFNLGFCHELIDFFKTAIKQNPNWQVFNFNFSNTATYADISQFYNEFEAQAYNVELYDVEEDIVNEAVESGSLYLFQIYNKDFSPKSKGSKDLYTLYFLELFSPENLANPKFKLNGGGTIFYRPASIREQDAIVHKAGTKTALKTSNHLYTLNYDITKNKRYTSDKFLFSFPITINFHKRGYVNLNKLIAEELKSTTTYNILGLHRGERCLLSYVVINQDNEILELGDLDTINGFNYNAKLTELASKRQSSRYEWNTIENIKDSKEGYLSIAVNEVTKLLRKYNALLAIENLDTNFKNSRAMIEKQVYQTFETNLNSKLQYLCDKSDVANGLQLVNFEDKFMFQNGIIFRVDPYFVTNVDVDTGYVAKFKFKYESLSAAQHLINSFESIHYQNEHFAFTFNELNINNKNSTSRNWTLVTSNETRYILDPETKSFEPIKLTKTFSELFNDFDINVTKDLKDEIIGKGSVKFYRKFIELLNCLMSVVQLAPNRNILVSPIMSKNTLKNKLKYSDINAAYNIARKVNLVIQNIKSEENPQYFIKKENWLSFLISSSISG